ncbi:MAG TPA: hypothetical protein VHR43_09065 [Gemmatimonadales bacterium]|nr:hypothetical protein [Gemmatimonadales bacterium]
MILRLGMALAPGTVPSPSGSGTVALQDTLTGHFLDSTVVTSPLPDPLVPIVQWFFQKPGWLMVSGLVVGGLVALALLVWLWRRRRAIGGWLVTRDRGVKLALGGAVGAVLLLVFGTGLKAYDYMMHDNDFCRGCHIFVPSGQVFVRPDTGTYLLVNRLEGKHDTLQCHACHAFEIKAQSKELFYWMMARPDKIPPHAKVPRRVCESCHVQGAAKKTWARIASTAGHRTHLESDSSALKDVACLTCHARTAHRFQPADTTCAQKGCHLTDDTRIRLGRMTARFEPGAPPLPNEEQLYCNSCHRFTAEAQFVSADSAAGLLRPASRQCFGCHEMRNLLAQFNEARDPHQGSCGMCHNPHTDVKPSDALKSCADAQCHATWREVDFHTGAAHRKVAQRCETCHIPHQARVDASDCVGCHERARGAKGGRLRPPVPFDTTKALRQTSVVPRPPGLVEPGRARGRGGAPPDDGPPGGGLASPTSPTDSFSHARHKRLACLTCHVPGSKQHLLTFEPPRGCDICHHQRPARSRCAECHQPDELAAPRPASVVVTVPRREPRQRSVPFDHRTHQDLGCTDCHVAPVTMAPADSVRSCQACHADHHAAGRTCAACHRSAETRTAHARPVQAHVACAACHTESTVTALVPSRSFCLACHEPAQDHYPERECSTCHFQRTPAELAPDVRRGGPT